jgi:hypothetical protein
MKVSANAPLQLKRDAAGIEETKSFHQSGCSDLMRGVLDKTAAGKVIPALVSLFSTSSRV